MRAAYIDFADGDGTVGGFVRIAVHDADAWCWLYVVTPDGTVVVRDHDVPRPRAGQLLAHGEGLWCELVCEVPGEHWAINAEAFGVRLDDPSDAWRGEIGHRLPVGLELDWEALAPVVHDGDEWSHQLGTVRGEVLLGSERIDFAGTGAREETTGDADWRAPRAVTSFIVGASLGVHLQPRPSRSYVWEARSEPRRVERADTRWELDDDGLLCRGHLDTDRFGISARPLAHAPVPIDAVARMPRALCRYDVDDGRVGYGWSEWLAVAPRE